MAADQLERWALEHDCPRTGKFLEVPFMTKILPRLAVVFGVAGVLFYANQKYLWHSKAATLDPTFIEDAKRVGNVRQRVNGPPVFSNPFYHRIPGNVLGPEDLDAVDE